MFERTKIECWLKLKQGVREIARQLGRSPSSVSREIKKYKTNRYRLEVAHTKALENRKKRGKRKLLHAYNTIKSPVLVEDVALEFSALGKLPGTFVKFFIEQAGLKNMIDMLKDKDRSAYGKCVFGYYDGLKMRF